MKSENAEAIGVAIGLIVMAAILLTVLTEEVAYKFMVIYLLISIYLEVVRINARTRHLS